MKKSIRTRISDALMNALEIVLPIAGMILLLAVVVSVIIVLITKTAEVIR